MEKAKLLIVEDEGIVALDLTNRLRGLGYTVSAVVSSGEKAVQTASETHPDLVLMDIRLKTNMDGIEAAREIYARFDIPVVYLSAMADDDTKQRANAALHFGYILKPFDERELHATIQKALYRHHADRESTTPTIDQRQS